MQKIPKIIYIFVLFPFLVWGGKKHGEWHEYDGHYGYDEDNRDSWSGEYDVDKDIGDWYKDLGVPRNASSDEILQAYKRKAKAIHPDHNPNNANANEDFIELTRKKDILLDPEMREKYDEMLTEQEVKKANKEKEKEERRKKERERQEEQKEKERKQQAKDRQEEQRKAERNIGATLLHHLVPEKHNLLRHLKVSDSVSYLSLDLIKFKIIEPKSERRRANMANTIIKNGVDINAQNGDGETALLLSIKWHYPLVFKQLLAHGADINLSDKWNNSPAHQLFSRPNKSVYPIENLRSYDVEDFVQRWFSSLFYKKDLDLSIRNHEGKTALELAVKNGYRRMALLIIKKETGYLSQNERERILRQVVEQSWPEVLKQLSNRNNLSTSAPSGSGFFKNCQRVFSGR